MAIAGRVAIVPKGEWDSSISYEKLDVVSYNNALYMAKKPSVGQVPADGEYWMLCVQSIDYSEFEKIINGTTTVGIADKAINDKNGDGIVDTYAKKNDLTNFQNKDGDSKDNTVTYTSADDTTADAWTDVAVLATGEKHSSLFAKISTMFKNIRYIYTHFIKSENILETLEEIVANTQSGKVAGALAVKELNSNLSNKLLLRSFIFGQGNSNVTLQFSGIAQSRCTVAILLLSSQSDVYSPISLFFGGNGGFVNVTEQTPILSENNIGIVCGSNNGQITIPPFGNQWGFYKILLLDDGLNVSQI